MAKAERKNTICPMGYFCPRKRTKADITANSSAEATLSIMALSTFMGYDRRQTRKKRANLRARRDLLKSGRTPHADLYRAGKLHRARDAQHPRQPETSGGFQGYGEEAGSDGERHVLDARTIRYRRNRRGAGRGHHDRARIEHRQARQRAHANAARLRACRHEKHSRQGIVATRRPSLTCVPAASAPRPAAAISRSSRSPRDPRARALACCAPPLSSPRRPNPRSAYLRSRALARYRRASNRRCRPG